MKSMRKHNIYQLLLSLTLSCALVFSGCAHSKKTSESISSSETTTTAQTTTESPTTEASVDITSKEAIEEQEAFDEFTDEMFRDEVSANIINLHYNLAHPENYGITDYEVTLGDYSEESMDEYNEDIDEYLEELYDFDYEILTQSQQITYDILTLSFETEKEYRDLYLYTENLSPTIGEQAQLPILLAEYHFYDEGDVKDYLKTLELIDGYFKSIIEFENRKVKAGLFMADFAVDDIVAQCQGYIKNPESNLLISTFNNSIDKLDIDDNTKKSYKKQNKDTVINKVIPAYQYLIDELTKLKGNGKNQGGLCNYEYGKEYYEYLVKTGAGTYRSIDEINEMLKEDYNDQLQELSLLYTFHPNILDTLDDYSEINPDDTPENLLNYLKTSIKDVFPEGCSDNFTVKYVDKSLEEHLSPAMYLTPALDKLNENIIYINNSSESTGAEYVVTLAHEGYPGHLYQNTYYANTNPSLIRCLFHCTGYSEGWATYAETYSYGYGGLSEAAADFNRINKTLTLNIYCQMDIGVNYYGWDQKKVADFITTNFGEETADEYAEEIYKSLIEEPGNYLNYYVGYLELINLRDTAKEALGDDFDLKEFHTFILDFGPAQFSVIEDYMEEWIEEQK